MNISEIDIWPPGVKMPVIESGKFRLSTGNFSKPEDYIENCKTNCLVMFSIRDEGSVNLTAEFKEKMNRVGGKSIDELSYRDSYVVLISDGVMIDEALASKNNVELDYKNGMHVIKLFSAGYDVGDSSLISVNGIDISPNQRGVNVVSIDYAKKLFLVQAFDTYGVVY